MDDIIQDFLAETNEGMSQLDNDLLTLEKSPEDQELLGAIFRVIHSIKGASGFLQLKRLAALAHAGENILDKMRDGKIVVSTEAISLVLEAVDGIKALLEHIESTGGEEPEGNDSELIAKLNAYASGGMEVTEAVSAAAEEAENAGSGDSAEMQALFDATPSLVDNGQAEGEAAPAAAGAYDHIDTSADSAEMQALFDATPSLVDVEPAPPLPPAEAEVPKPIEEPKKEAAEPKKEGGKAASGQSIRVNLDLLEHLMQQASELVLTRNQLLQMIRDKEESEFTVPLQRLNYITTELQEGVMKTRMQPISNAWTPLPRIVRDLA